MLSGITTTYQCATQGNAVCEMSYYGVTLPKTHILAVDYEKYRVGYICDDTKFAGWRNEQVFITTRDQEGWQGENQENDAILETILTQIEKVMPDYQVRANLQAVLQGETECMYQ